MTLSRAVANLAAFQALVPAGWLVALRVRGRKVDAAWWWLALAFAVSFGADSVARVLPADQRWLVGLAYPVSQAALVGAVFLSRLEAAQFVTALVIVAIADALWHGVAGPDVLLRTVAWLGAAGLVVDRWALGRLRTALLVSFGLACVAWWGYATWPGWPSWLLYQGVRALGIGLFCLAALQPGPRFSLIRRGS